MQKEPQVTYKNMERSMGFDALIQQRIEALERRHPGIIGCRVVVEVPHRAPETAKVPVGIAVEVEIAGHPLVVAKDTQERREAKDDQTASLNNAFDAVERQLERIADTRGRQVKQHEGVGESGVVVRLFPEQSYGFVEVAGSPELYFSRNGVVGGDFDELTPGMLVQVTRATEEGPMGPQASSVRLQGKRKAPE